MEIEQQISDINRKIEQKELEQNDIRNSFSKRKGELEQAIREQEQKKKEIEQEMKKQYDKMECEYTELSRKRKNSTPLHSIFKTKSEDKMIEDKMIEDLEKLNNAMRLLKKSIVSNPQILECEEMISKLKIEYDNQLEKADILIAQIIKNVNEMKQELSELENKKQEQLGLLNS